VNEPNWVTKEALIHLHNSSLARFGGHEGLRDEGLLESALHRPINRYNYEEGIDLADLAASYAFGVAQNHAFIDGNKRMALLACGVFLDINGCRLVASSVDAYHAIVALAAGEIGEREFAAWIRQNCKLPDPP
jgi:death-on-curing protein